MLMYAMIGAVVCGIGLAVAHSNAKKGVPWGQPVEVLCGILAIAFAFWAIYENTFGKPETQKIAEQWQEVRGIGAAEWLKANAADKKMLVIKSAPVEGQTDYQFEALKKSLEGANFTVFELPKPPEMEEGSEMMFDMSYGLSKEARKIVEAQGKEIDAAIKAAGADYDTVVFYSSVLDYFIYPKNKMNPIGTIPAFQKKKFIFLYGIDQAKAMDKRSNIIAYLSDKALPNPDDYDKAPTGDQAADFSTRYEFKMGAGK